ncbi:MerR family transcriptional regulator [Georgenia sp. SYP-B2076]|uniref:MerR family transcriptional regulator n=1 Tax=Georgenia sp. SYP-B2076 TaxID=2495881 RepID=UPI001F0CA238|nr:MerR family transcriptional regulator [Georgenia sp. SYP-B2076]
MSGSTSSEGRPAAAGDRPVTDDPATEARSAARPRAVQGGATGAPLTVAAVAARLGVAASTLRTWDRRYGLGPSSHEAGSHRRYTPADVARLERMRHLTLQGVAPSDAAQAAVAPVGAEVPRAWAGGAGGAPHEGAEHPERLLVDPLSLAAAAMEPDEPRVHRMLDQEVRDVGIVRTWTKLAKPALTMLAQRERSDRPGVDPEAVITAAVLLTVREASAAAEHAGEHGVHVVPAGAAAGAHNVLLCAGADQRLRAHVIAGGLAEHGVRGRVLRLDGGDPDQVLRTLSERRASVLAVLGDPPGTEELVRAVSERGDVEIFLLGGGVPDLWLPRVRRVRTAPAAVEEIAGMFEE